MTSQDIINNASWKDMVKMYGIQSNANNTYG